jgi:hypothetical protein
VDSNSRSRRVDTGHLLVEHLRGADGGRRGHHQGADGARRVVHLPVGDGGLQAAHLPAAVDLRQVAPPAAGLRAVGVPRVVRQVDLRVVDLLAADLLVADLQAGPRVEDRRAAGAPLVVRRQGDGGLRAALRRAVGDRRVAHLRAVGVPREDRRAALRLVGGALLREGTVPQRVAMADRPGLGTPAGILPAGIRGLPLKRVARATLSLPAMR